MPHLSVRLAIATGLLVALAPGSRAQLVKDWHAVRSPHFDILSRYDPAKVEPLAQTAEWARDVLQLNLGYASKRARSALVYVLDNPYDFEQLAPAPTTQGFYAGAPWRDLIVLRDLSGARHAMLHEYTHLILRHNMNKAPAWFHEGTAEYYAELEEKDGAALAGLPEKRRMDILKKGAWIPPSDLTLAESSSSMPPGDWAIRFYAQSYLYIHMLHQSPDYKAKFDQFREAVGNGTPAHEAMRKIYNKPLSKFDEDARVWFQQQKFTPERLQLPPKENPPVETRTVDQIEVDIAHATVMAAGKQSSQAGGEYGRLSRLAGSRCELRAALGDLAFAARLVPEAIKQYRAGEACGIRKDELEGLGLMSSAQGPGSDSEQSARPVAGRGVGHLTAVSKFFANDYEGALRDIEQAGPMTPSDQFRVTRVKALSLAKLGRFDEAEKEAAKLQGLAKEPEDVKTAQLTVDDVKREKDQATTEAEPLHKAMLRNLTQVEGELVQVDCMQSRARFTVQSKGATIKLLIADPGDVVTGSSENAPKLEFACGPQKRKVLIGYKAEPDAASGTAGRIRYLEFR